MKRIPFFGRNLFKQHNEKPRLEIGERAAAAMPEPVIDPKKTAEPDKQVLPVKILAIEESRVGNNLGYRWTIPNDTMEAVKLLKILEVEINSRIQSVMKPQSKIHRV